MKPLLLYLLHTPANCTLACLAVTCCSLQFLELGTKTEGSIKEKKDPTKPKGVLSINSFYDKHNKRIREENTTIDCRGITKKCAEEYAALDAAGKAMYTDMYEKDKKRFAMEMKTYYRHNMDEAEDDEGT